MTIPARVDIISDAICPWCYVGKRHLEQALPQLAEQGLSFDIQWHSFQLNPDMPEAGLDRREYRTAKFGSWERSQELDAQLAERGRAAGLEFRMDLQRRTPNTLAAHRTIRLAHAHGVQTAVVEALFAGYFTQGADIGDAATLARLADGARLPADAVLAMLAGEEGRAEVLAEDVNARRSGINGVPSFIMANHVLFSGAVPAETMVEAFAHAWRILSSQAA
jgi:predicted DsbA family dithiol-disulfide isomerase